ncbi:MAG: iron-containing redox enzyme family protein [Bdellovibrionales bacterium]|nr:iron-containing redox enzyme family protein [Bdellovibrionales bacterium]
MESLKALLYSELDQLELMTDQFEIEKKEVYGDWLAQTYYFVCHSTKLLALASARFETDRKEFHYRFAEHIKEERGHELMALNDLERLGFSIEQFDELPQTKAFYQSQYFWTTQKNPISFYGYILCLEVFAIRGAVRLYNKVCEAFGPESAVFLRVHTKEDIHHVEEAFRHLQHLHSDEFSQIEENMRLSTYLYKEMYKAIAHRRAAS